MDDINEHIGNFVDRMVAFFPNVIFAIIYLVVGLLIIKLFRKFMTRLMAKRKMDPTVLKFLMDMLTWVFRVLLIISVISKLGVPTTSFVAVIGAAGLAIGLSLQGSLSNFAGGLLIIMFKPIRVGDYIEAQGEGGTVAAIRIFNTKLLTPNNQTIYLPNGALSNGNIKNYSKEPTRKAEIVISVGYECDLKHVKSVLMRIVNNDPRILTDPAPAINVKELAENAVNLQVFVWATNEDYWQILSDFLESTKEEFGREGIEIPFPQRDVRIRQMEVDKA